MKKVILTLLLIFYGWPTWSQVRKEWREGYKLSVLDFSAEPPKARDGQGPGFYLAASLDFDDALALNEFRLTKNFNSHVVAYFIPNLSWLQQGEGTEILLQYAQMDFDLLELYARKFRQRLYQEKNAVSNSRFFQQVQAKVQAELERRAADMQSAAAESDEKGRAFHDQILKEIAALSDFCQDCKPTQRKE